MNKKQILTFSLLIFINTVLAPAQIVSDCLRDYSLLQQVIQTNSFDIKAGDDLFLSKTYLQALEEGDYDRAPSGMKHWEYVRPASRKELKDGIVAENAEEKVGSDGNIYIVRTTPSSVHFFQPGDNFKGDFTPVWEDPVMRVPLGLIPVNVLGLSNRLFTLKEKNSDYLLIEVSGRNLVFYPGYPTTDEVFDTREVLEKISEKQNLAAALLGRSFRATHSPNLYYRTRPGGLNHSFDPSLEYLDFEVKDVIATRKEVLLAYPNGDEVLYLVIDEESDFTLSEMDCIVYAQRERAMVDVPDEEEIDRQLSALILGDVTVEEMVAREGVVKGLRNRFTLKNDGRRSGGRYLHLTTQVDMESTDPCIFAELDEKGALCLTSRFSSKKGLYHTRIELYVDEEEPVVSRRISTVDPYSSRHQTSGLVIEEIRFVKGADGGIIEAIARNTDRPMKIRFTAGGSYFKDIELDQEHKDAIRDAWLLALIMNARE